MTLFKQSEALPTTVIVTTIEQSGDLAFCGLESGYFTHIFIDEAAQIMECQSLIPLQLATYNPNPGKTFSSDNINIITKFYQ